MARSAVTYPDAGACSGLLGKTTLIGAPPPRHHAAAEAVTRASYATTRRSACRQLPKAASRPCLDQQPPLTEQCRDRARLLELVAAGVTDRELRSDGALLALVETADHPSPDAHPVVTARARISVVSLIVMLPS
jgi:hypothetical protein